MYYFGCLVSGASKVFVVAFYMTVGCVSLYIGALCAAEGATFHLFLGQCTVLWGINGNRMVISVSSVAPEGPGV